VPLPAAGLPGGEALTRAKVTCVSVTKRASNVWDPDGKVSKPGFVYEAEFYPVTGDSSENKSFFASTPTGNLKLGTIREDHFVPGKSYYVDFTPAEGS